MSQNVISVSEQQANQDMIFRFHEKSPKSYSVHFNWVTVQGNVIIRIRTDKPYEKDFPHTVILDIPDHELNNIYSCRVNSNETAKFNFREIYQNSVRFLVIGKGDNVLKNGVKTDQRVYYGFEKSPNYSITVIPSRNVAYCYGIEIKLVDPYRHIFNIIELKPYIRMLFDGMGMINKEDEYVVCGKRICGGIVKNIDINLIKKSLDKLSFDQLEQIDKWIKEH